MGATHASCNNAKCHTIGVLKVCIFERLEWFEGFRGLMDLMSSIDGHASYTRLMGLIGLETLKRLIGLVNYMNGKDLEECIKLGTCKIIVDVATP